MADGTQPGLRFTPLMRRLTVHREPFRHADCQRQSQCLREFLMIKRNWNARGAECPRLCASHAPTERWLAVERNADGVAASSLADAERWAIGEYIGRVGSDEKTADEVVGGMAEDGNG
jgi:hypothetical protein